MAEIFRAFDTHLAGVVAKIPTVFEKPFVWLGRFTTPILWACYLALLHMLVLTPGRLEGVGLMLVILLPVASVIKLFFRRKRPPTIYAESMKIKSYSFPSSHAYAGLLGGAYLATVALNQGAGLAAAVAFVFGLLIGISRIRIGAHYPSDVIGGWLLAILTLSIVLAR